MESLRLGRNACRDISLGLDKLEFSSRSLLSSKSWGNKTLMQILWAMLATSLGSNLHQVVIVKDMTISNFVEKPLVGVHSIQIGPRWMDPLVTFLKQGLLLEDKGEAEKIRRKAPHYWLSEEQKLYKCSHSRPYLLYVHPEAMEPLLEELHEGICGSHTGGRSLAHSALTQGYWWPSMQKTF